MGTHYKKFFKMKNNHKTTDACYDNHSSVRCL